MSEKQIKQTRERQDAGAIAAPDAIRMLKTDHATVQQLFKEFEDTDNSRRKQELAATLCAELTVHATIEEEIFYPAVREVLSAEDLDLLDEAEVEHATAKELIAQIEAGAPGDELWDAKVTVLSEYIDHHVKEEQDEMFPKIQKSDIDLKALGAQLQVRKQELKSELPVRKISRNVDSRSVRPN